MLEPAPVAVTDYPRSSPRLAAVSVQGAEYQRAVDDYHRAIDDFDAMTQAVPATEAEIQATLDRQHRATDRFGAQVRELGDLLAARTRVEGELSSATRRRDKADLQIGEIRVGLRNMAVNEYVAGGFGGAPEQLLDLQGANTLASRKVLLLTVKGDRMAELTAISGFRDDNDRLVTDRQAQLDEISRRASTTEAARDQAVRDRDVAAADEQLARAAKARAEAALADQQSQIGLRRNAVADARMSAEVKGLDLPFVVLNAYLKAADRFGSSCGIRWSALAGIGRTESNHGTFGGATVDRDGNETKPIYGIPLNGANGTTNVGDTDGGVLDGDSSTDRAMGPMQFIPSSWRALGTDGDSDGRADPQNYYDATASAANLLCRKGPGLDGDEGLRRAFRSYNNDGHYVETVLERAHNYDRYRLPSPDSAADPARDIPGSTAPGSS